MSREKVHTVDSVGVELIRGPAKPVERPLLCPQCGALTLEAERAGWRTCTNPECFHSCAAGACITSLVN